MKSLVWLPVALLVGLVLGGLGPRVELRKARKEIRRLQRVVEEPRGSSRDFGDVTRMLRIPDESAAAANDQPATPSGDTTAGANETETAAAASSPEEQEGERPARDERADLEARIEQAVELWRVRSDVARSSFVANAGLSEDETVQFDVLIEAMNLRFGTAIDDWAGQFDEGAVVGPEAGARLINDLSGIIVLTYDEMDRNLPATWRRDSGEDFDLADFVDPTVAMPLVDMEDRIRWNRGGRRR